MHELERLALRFDEGLREGRSLDDALAALLEATGGRAAGLWHAVSDGLHVAGFQAAGDMPPDVDAGFRAATRFVPLEQAGLGIVRAVVSGQPALAYARSAGRGGSPALAASAGWLERFAARSSLAVPIRGSGGVAGVIAVSTAEVLSIDSATGRLLVGLAQRLEGALQAEAGDGPARD